MRLPEELQGKSREEQEEWFLSAVESKPLPTEQMLAVLEDMGGLNAGSADGLAELMQDALAESDDQPAMLHLMELRCGWTGDTPEFRRVCKKAVKPVFSTRLGKAFVKNAGFGDKIAPSECIRRLKVLSKLEKGTLCYEKTWGFGTVKRVDDFYERVTIDFINKPGHEMSMAYASETLELISNDHLLARLHGEPEALKTMLKEDPAEVVRITLRSYGAMNVLDLKDRLVDEVMPESDWKSFWDAARKPLKKDIMVHIPAKRADPITLLSSPDEHLEQQFSGLSALRDPESIIAKVDALDADGAFKDLGGENAVILGDRLGFAIWGAEGRHPDLMARALLMSYRYGVVSEEGTIGERRTSARETLEALLDSKVLPAALTKLPVRSVSGLLELASKELPDVLAERLIALLSKLSISVVTESIMWIEKIDHEQDLIEFIDGVLAERKASPALMLWILRNIEKVEGWGHSDRAELLRQGFDAIEWPDAGEQLRAQHQIRGLFESGSWFAEKMQILSPEQRVVMLNLVQSCRGWEEADKRGVLAGIIKKYPELHQAVGAGAEVVEESKGRFTSWRTYRERKEQFKKLTEIEIPENAREIAVARSYGDLRENAEYKYAKEHQRILYLRRDEMEADINAVKGHDFSGRSIEHAGMGTIVTIMRPDACEERFCILGEWDRDEELNIISNLSRLAQMLDGHSVGEKVKLPADEGDELCEIVAIEELDDAVRAWLGDKAEG
jgi:transcription elongation GreA/GreB family factor